MTRQSFYFFLVVFAVGTCEKCSLPESWSGAWFIKDFDNGPERVVNSSTNEISRHTSHLEYDNSILGTCIWMNKDFYVFRYALEACIKCTIITERHENILFSRESICIQDTEENRDPSMIETLCLRELDPSNEDKYFWFRTNYKPAKCPFQDSSYKFSYKRNDGSECGDPPSRSSTCLDRTKMELHYEACHDNYNSDDKDYELTCIGDWEETLGHRHFVADMRLLNKVDFKQGTREGFRCFTYATLTDDTGLAGRDAVITGYQIGTVREATCNGLEHPEAAETILYLKNEILVDDRPCSFPAWLASHNWINMEKTVEFEVAKQDKNASIRIHPVLKENDVIIHGFETLTSPQHGNLVCLQKDSIPGDNKTETTAIVAKYTVGCKVDLVCLQLSSRSPFIFQMNYLKRGNLDSNSFRKLCFRNSTTEMTGVTMISTKGQRGSCLRPGEYLRLAGNETNSLFQPDSRETDWRIGCDEDHTGNINEYSCLDGWQENESHYDILSPDKNPNKGSPLFCMKTGLLPGESQVQITSQDCFSFKNSSGEAEESFSLTRTAYCNSTPVAGNSNSHLVADDSSSAKDCMRNRIGLLIVPLILLALSV